MLSWNLFSLYKYYNSIKKIKIKKTSTPTWFLAIARWLFYPPSKRALLTFRETKGQKRPRVEVYIRGPRDRAMLCGITMTTDHRPFDFSLSLAILTLLYVRISLLQHLYLYQPCAAPAYIRAVLSRLDLSTHRCLQVPLLAVSRSPGERWRAAIRPTTRLTGVRDPYSWW